LRRRWPGKPFDLDLDPDGKVASAFADDLVAALVDERLLVRV
jgi:hypothetical protein